MNKYYDDELSEECVYPDFLTTNFELYCNGCQHRTLELVPGFSSTSYLRCIHKKACERIYNKFNKSEPKENK